MTHRVLIVDDHPDLRKLIRMTLAQGLYEFEEAADSDAALARARELRPRIVLLDVMLPGTLDGYGVCRAIKNDPALEGTAVVMLTARGQQHDREAGEEAGADAYLVKPFSPSELAALVAGLCSIP